MFFCHFSKVCMRIEFVNNFLIDDFFDDVFYANKSFNTTYRVPTKQTERRQTPLPRLPLAAVDKAATPPQTAAGKSPNLGREFNNSNRPVARAAGCRNYLTNPRESHPTTIQNPHRAGRPTKARRPYGSETRPNPFPTQCTPLGRER